jgi:hypothetical protein
VPLLARLMLLLLLLLEIAATFMATISLPEV